MTAFARGQIQEQWGAVSVEIKSINHRYLDINMRLPEMLRALEMPLRALIRKQLQRGKVDYTLRYTAASTTSVAVVLNQALVEQMIDAATQVTKQIEQPQALSAMDILRWPGVMQVAENDLSVAHQTILELTTTSLAELNHTRQREGDALSDCVLARVDEIEVQLSQFMPRCAAVVEQQRRRLQEKINGLNISLDAIRLEQEVALLAQRIDIAEELDRLTAHLKETRYVLNKGGPVGRRLDFLMQELNREANTIAAKSIDSEMTKVIVDIKVLIEQIREQVQNIE